MQSILQEVQIWLHTTLWNLILVEPFWKWNSCLQAASEQHLIRLRGQLHEKEVEIAHLKAEVCRHKQDAGVVWENQEKQEQIEELQRRNAALEKTVRRLQEEREHLLYQSSTAAPG